MRRRWQLAVLSSLVLSALVLAPARGAQPQSPEDFLGHEVGADRKLARYDTVLEYL